MSIKKMLEDREPLYGSFAWRAVIACKLIAVLEEERNERAEDEWMSPAQEHAIRMIMEKLSRLIAGNAGVEDTWQDIAGYAIQGKLDGQLVEVDPTPKTTEPQEIENEHRCGVQGFSAQTDICPACEKIISNTRLATEKELLKVRGPALPLDATCVLYRNPKCTCIGCRPDLIRAAQGCAYCGKAEGRPHAVSCSRPVNCVQSEP